jgi:hypothetical protein
MGEMAEFRITAAPGIVDRTVIAGLAPMLQGARKVFLQPMQTRVELLDPNMKDKPPITLKELAEYREILLQFVDKCEIRGKD